MKNFQGFLGSAQSADFERAGATLMRAAQKTTSIWMDQRWM
jgi:hypothetical protein